MIALKTGLAIVMRFRAEISDVTYLTSKDLDLMYINLEGTRTEGL
jgi:hypothetical protein